MNESGEATKTASWGLVLAITGIVFLLIGLVGKTPGMLILGAVVLAAGAVTQAVSNRRHQ